MKLPIQAQPVIRQISTASYSNQGIALSESCGCPNKCDGFCLFGACIGVCR
jgi:hypothetical protein